MAEQRLEAVSPQLQGRGFHRRRRNHPHRNPSPGVDAGQRAAAETGTLVPLVRGRAQTRGGDMSRATRCFWFGAVVLAAGCGSNTNNPSTPTTGTATFTGAGTGTLSVSVLGGYES